MWGCHLFRLPGIPASLAGGKRVLRLKREMGLRTVYCHPRTSAPGRGRVPKVFNTVQGSQYTSREWQEQMKENGIVVSQDGKGRWADDIVMARFRRTYKH